MVGTNGDTLAFLTGGSAPLNVWFRLVAGYKDDKVSGSSHMYMYMYAACNHGNTLRYSKIHLMAGKNL